MNRNKLLRLLVILAVVIGAGTWWYGSRKHELDADHLSLYGNVDIREIDLAFNNSEHLDQLLVQEGDVVEKGQLLATLHRERLQAEVAAAEARVAAQQAVVERLHRGSRPQEIRGARAQVDTIKAHLADARATFNRTRDLVAKHSISQQALDDARAELDMARASLKAAEETLALAVEGPRAEDIAEAEAVLKANQAQLTLAREVLKDSELFAPADGVIRNRVLEPGDMVSPQTPVLTLALTNPVWVRAYTPETELGKLTLGMPADVSTDSYPGKAYRGWVGYISPTAEFTPKNVQTPELRTRLVYQVRVYVCNPQDELRLGMPATVSIPLDPPKPEAGHTTPDCTPSGDK